MISREVRLRKKIETIERKYELDLGPLDVVISGRLKHMAEFIPKGKGGQINLPQEKQGRRLHADLYHEMGHAFLKRYRIPRDILDEFTGRKGSGLRRKEIKEHESEDSVPYGFASCYATESKEEDFCETFSVFILNNSRTSGTVDYDGIYLNLKSDPVLRRKLRAVKAALSWAGKNASNGAVKNGRMKVAASFIKEPDKMSDGGAFDIQTYWQEAEAGKRDFLKYIGECNERELARIRFGNGGG